MSVLTTIGGVPLFSTQAEALAWASSNNLTGYHTHTYQGQTGFMGGQTHSNATNGTRPTNTSSGSANSSFY